MTRGRKLVDMPRGGHAAERALDARRLLADSTAVTRYRALADSLIDTDDQSPAALAVIIADATVGLLSGDVGAPRRLAKHLAGRGGVGARPAGMALDCFTVMEQRMTEAWRDYTSCYISVSDNPLYAFYQELCATRWVVQVESYWFGFVSCTGFNW
ncbi:MAG: hypothetical protein QM736_08445 [Vicinamibacterales bacterium]